MKKRLFFVFIAALLLFGTLALGACTNDNKIVHTIRTVGMFSGYRVDYIRIEYTDGTAGTAVEVKYYVDDVYIKTCANSSYDYYVYITEKKHILLGDAYEQGLLTHDDLLAVAEAEKPYDTLYDEDTDGPIVGRPSVT